MTVETPPQSPTQGNSTDVQPYYTLSPEETSTLSAFDANLQAAGLELSPSQLQPSSEEEPPVLPPISDIFTPAELAVLERLHSKPLTQITPDDIKALDDVDLKADIYAEEVEHTSNEVLAELKAQLELTLGTPLGPETTVHAAQLALEILSAQREQATHERQAAIEELERLRAELDARNDQDIPEEIRLELERVEQLRQLAVTAADTATELVDVITDPKYVGPRASLRGRQCAIATMSCAVQTDELFREAASRPLSLEQLTIYNAELAQAVKQNLKEISNIKAAIRWRETQLKYHDEIRPEDQVPGWKRIITLGFSSPQRRYERRMQRIRREREELERSKLFYAQIRKINLNRDVERLYAELEAQGRAPAQILERYIKQANVITEATERVVAITGFMHMLDRIAANVPAGTVETVVRFVGSAIPEATPAEEGEQHH